MVLVDTPIWSAGMRRRRGPTSPEAEGLAELIAQGRAALIGAIRQEVLSGIRDEAQFERLRDGLRAFPDIPVLTADYEQAAHFFNTCRRHGIQGSGTDYLLCAVAVRYGIALYTTDGDFARYAAYVPLILYEREGEKSR